MVRTILSTLVMTAAIVAVDTAAAYAEEVCVKASVIQNNKPAGGVDECQPTPFQTHANGDCTDVGQTEACWEVVA